MKTMADHARAYRQRKAKKMERLAVLEAALESIANNMTVQQARDLFGDKADFETAYGAFVDIARQALNPDAKDV